MTKKDLTVLPSTRFHQQRKVLHLYHSDQDEEQGHSTDLEKPKDTNRHCAISPQSYAILVLNIAQSSLGMSNR